MSLEYVGIAGFLYIALFTLVVPAVAVRSARRYRTRAMPPAGAVFRSVLIQQSFILLLALGVARVEWVPLFVAPDRWKVALPLSVAVTIALVLAMRPMWRRAVARQDARVQLLMPRTAGERLLWIAVSVAAGVAEEIAYRGVLWILLERWLGSSVAGALVAAAAFGIAHALQGWRGTVVVTAVALGMHVLVRVTGSLLAPILVHVAYDIVAGFTYAALERTRTARTPVPPDWPTPF